MSDGVDLQALVRTINEVLILAALRNGPKHGYQIALEVERRSGGKFTFQHGTLYPILHRLERARLIRGEWDASGGRRRKVYAVTERGLTHLATEADRIRGVCAALQTLLEADA